jgi:hypothetical protein
MKYNLNTKIIILTSITFITSIFIYRNYCDNITLKKNNENFEQKEQWEKELEIYNISMPKFYTKFPKKSKCILLISGYKDIPYLWNEFEKYLINDEIDFYAPRTCGNGRSFYQIVNWKDWVITYLEAIYLLQEQYDSIDIIGFSTGCVIALYLTQFKYKCTINNLFLCAPFLINKQNLSIDLLFSSNIFSKILNRIYAWTFRFHIKSIGKFKGCRDTYNEYYSLNDFYEMVGDIEMETILFEFIKFRPKSLFVNNIIILYPNDDDVIGNIHDQLKIISNVFTLKPIKLISIPSYLQTNKLSNKSGHLMFKEKPEIIKNIYDNIKKYL